MRHSTARSRALLALPAAVLLAMAVALVPPAVPGARLPASLDIPVARAASGLEVTSDTRYVVDPAGGAIHVTVGLVARNTTPDGTGSDGGAIRYYYDTVNVGVQPEGVDLRAVQDGAPVRVDVTDLDGYRLVAIPLRTAIFNGEVASVELAYDLPAGAPRSSSDVRVGLAFASFLAWSFGDSGTIRIEVPSAFSTDITGGDTIRTTIGQGTDVFTATTSDAATWNAWVNARNDAGLTTDRLDIPGGEQVVVRGWPEDPAWRGHVASLLTRGVPVLAARIGLPWPVTGPLNVLEIHTPLLEGYAGFYNVAKTEITVSEDLEPLTIVHEASHAWFNGTLFTERWIAEGLADEYATAVLRSLGEAAPDPKPVSRSDPAAFPLRDWPPPAAIHDAASSAKEEYGYAAASTVVHAVVGSAGEAGMRRVFRAAHDRTTAYVGSPPPETGPEPTVLPNDWRRFLDLTEELGGASGVADLLSTWALTPADAAQLAPRAAAVAAYHALLAGSGGRGAPWAVRAPLDAWTFDLAMTRIATADRIVTRLDEIRTLASSIGLEQPASLEGGYRDAVDPANLDAVEPILESAGSSLAEVAAASRAAGAPRDWLVLLGLLGSEPDAGVAGARDAWARTSWSEAATLATAARTILEGADAMGRQRVAIGGGAAAAIVLLVLLVRVRGRRRRTPEPPDRYATLPASASPGWATDNAGETTSEHGMDATDTQQGADRS